MKKIIFIIVTVIIIICLGVAGFFGIRYLTAPTDITIMLNDEVLDVDKVDDILTYNEDVTISWDNEHYKVICNGIEILPGSYISENSLYTFEFKFKDVEKSFQIFLNKDLTFTLQDYDGNTIHNYTTNYKPFKIITEDEIKVNNLPFDTTNGIYKIGDYKLTSKNFDPCIIKLNGINQMSEYNFYITSGSLSTLYAGLNLVNTDRPTFVWYGESSALNNEALMQNTNITISEFVGDSDKLIYEVLDEFKSKIKQIYNEDRNAYFHLYIDDSKHWLEYPLFAELGLDDSRYDVTYYSTDSKSYDFENSKYSFTNENDYKLFLQIQKESITLLDEVKSNKYVETKDYLLGILPKKYEYFNDYILPSTFRNNVTYVLEYPELLKFKDEKITTLLANNSYIYKSSISDIYNSLTDTQKDLFLQYINFDKLDFEFSYLNKDNNKDYLIITGDDKETSKEYFEAIIKQIDKKYSTDYNILFKPALGTTLNEDYTKILNDLEITVLPDTLPVEAISFMYENVKIGGFTNSLYTSIPQDQILFFIGKDKSELESPLDSLYDGLFKNIVFITANTETDNT